MSPSNTKVMTSLIETQESPTKPQRPQFLSTILNLSQTRSDIEHNVYRDFLEISDTAHNDIAKSNLAITAFGRYHAPSSSESSEDKEHLQNGSLLHIFMYDFVHNLTYGA